MKLRKVISGGVKFIAEEFEVWNIAGNRKRTNPGVVGLVEEAFKTL